MGWKPPFDACLRKGPAVYAEDKKLFSVNPHEWVVQALWRYCATIRAAVEQRANRVDAAATRLRGWRMRGERLAARERLARPRSTTNERFRQRRLKIGIGISNVIGISGFAA